MSDKDLERRLEGLHLRRSDPAFMQTLKARVASELAGSQPASWWGRNRFAVANGGLAAAIVLTLLLQPGLPRPTPSPEVTPDSATVDEVRQTFTPSALVLRSRSQVQREPLPSSLSDPDVSIPKDSRRDIHDQTSEFLAAQ